jgi:hypothetical protein
MRRLFARAGTLWGEATVLALLAGMVLADALEGKAAGAPRLIPSVTDVGDLAAGETMSVSVRVENPGAEPLSARMVSTCECLSFPMPEVAVGPYGSTTLVAALSAEDRRGRNEVFGQLIGADGTAYAMMRVDFTAVDPFAVSLVATRDGESGSELEYSLEYRGKSPPAGLWAIAEAPGRVRAELRQTGPGAWSVRAQRPKGVRGPDAIRLYAGAVELQRILVKAG